jgi:replication initiation and membrane attachment protein DnaB
MNTNANSKFNACLVTPEDKQIIQDLRAQYNVTEKQLMSILVALAVHNGVDVATRAADINNSIANAQQANKQAKQELQAANKLQRQQLKLQAKQAKDAAKQQATGARKMAREQAKQSKAADPHVASNKKA